MSDDIMIKEFMEKRFGMFIHWGVYSLLGGEWAGKSIEDELGEWIMNVLQIPVKDYEKIAASFDPVNFDADKIVKLAKKAGMKYIVITTKHHDGFAIFNSKCDRYNIVEWARFKRDPVSELADACRANDMKLGFYYSQALDWHEEDAGGWEVRPNNKRISWGNTWDYPDNEKKDFARYFEKKVKPQVRELLTRYGDVFLIWFDTPRTITAAQSDELYKLVKSLQPNCLINSRIGNGKGDYGSLGDNQIPAVSLKKPYESPVTLNDTWGYKHFDQNWKSSEEIIEMLVKLASRNVNFLLNIGPDGNGDMTDETIDILSGISDWISMNSEAVFGTSGNPAPGEADWGYVTTKQNKLYLFLKKSTSQKIEFNGLKTKVINAYLLRDRSKIEIKQKIDCVNDIYLLEADIPSTDQFYPVYVMECSNAPEFCSYINQQGLSLSLYPLMAELFDGSLKKAETVFMDNIYSDYSHFGKLKVQRSGSLDGWSKRNEYIIWEAYFHKEGRYKVELVTNKLGISERSREDAEIEITINDDEFIRTDLKKDFIYSDSRSSAYNNYIGTICDHLIVPKPGFCKIKMRLINDLQESKDMIPLIFLRFSLANEGEGE